MPRVIAVVGPTASGKTELAVALAGRLGGEVVSADSRQLYRGFDAGTAKPVRPAVPYHLVDSVEPSETVSAGRYARMAAPILEDIARRGRVPIVAGGTGLYVRALLEGLSPLPEADPAVRARLEGEARGLGLAALHARLAQADPAAAAAIPAGNRQRVIRALEVLALTGRPISSFWKRREGAAAGDDAPVYLSIEWSPAALRERISERGRAMWPAILAEARVLLGRLSGAEPAFQSLGYREALGCLAGRTSPEEGLRLMIRSTLAYAKRQRTWFRRQVPGALRVEGGPAGRMLEAALAGLP